MEEHKADDCHEKDGTDLETRFFNQGSPWNVAAGEGTADLSKLAEHFDKFNEQRESERVERMSAKSKN